jgi:outer membrane immunogenic protein
MKSFLRGTTALAGIVIAGSAFAADLPRRAAPPVFVPVPVFTWTGAYFGINAGYGFDAGSNSDRYNLPAGSVLNGGPVNRVFNANSSNDLEGFVGGGQVGYNYQFTPGSGVVVGIEADAQYTDFGNKTRTVNGTFSPVVGGLNGTTAVRLPGNEMNFFGTVRGRIGYAFDRVLFYGTGGFAYGSGSADRSFGGFAGNDSFRTGWTVGGGMEYALPVDSFLNFFRSSAVTLKVEGLYVNLDRGTRNQGAFVINAANNFPVVYSGVGRRSDEFAVVRAGLNYKFGSY